MTASSAPVQFTVSKKTVSKEILRTKIDEKLKELGFESNYNNINSDWHVYKAYTSDILVTDNVIEFFDFIEADINVYDRGEEYVVEVNRYAGNISEIELYFSLKQSFLPIEETGSIFSKRFAYIKHIIMSILSILAFFCRFL